MKRVILLILVLAVPLTIILSLVYENKTTTPQKSSAQDTESISNAQNSLQIGDFTFSWFEVTKIDNLKLVPNFDEKLSSREVISRSGCKYLSNAGFYSKENTPLGLFVAGGKKISEFQNNSLLDGVLSINDMAVARITRDEPRDNLPIAVQSGPIVKENANYIKLKIQNDSEARRVVAAVNGENKLFFIVIYKTSSEYLGPLLGDLPNVLRNFEEKSGIIFADIVNLDGGAASTFHSESKSLIEISSVGAFFCQL